MVRFTRYTRAYFSLLCSTRFAESKYFEQFIACELAIAGERRKQTCKISGFFCTSLESFDPLLWFIRYQETIKQIASKLLQCPFWRIYDCSLKKIRSKKVSKFQKSRANSSYFFKRPKCIRNFFFLSESQTVVIELGNSIEEFRNLVRDKCM